jgi:hypothetical protein
MRQHQVFDIGNRVCRVWSAEHENVLKHQNSHNLIESIDVVLSSSLADRLERKKVPFHVTSLPFFKYLGDLRSKSSDNLETASIIYHGIYLY